MFKQNFLSIPIHKPFPFHIHSLPSHIVHNSRLLLTPCYLSYHFSLHFPPTPLPFFNPSSLFPRAPSLLPPSDSFSIFPSLFPSPFHSSLIFNPLLFISAFHFQLSFTVLPPLPSLSLSLSSFTFQSSNSFFSIHFLPYFLRSVAFLLHPTFLNLFIALIFFHFPPHFSSHLSTLWFSIPLPLTFLLTIPLSQLRFNNPLFRSFTLSFPSSFVFFLSLFLPFHPLFQFSLHFHPDLSPFLFSSHLRNPTPTPPTLCYPHVSHMPSLSADSLSLSPLIFVFTTFNVFFNFNLFIYFYHNPSRT